jgi:sigma-B regulation protein RsbU (phosphoserine phosphatase)
VFQALGGLIGLAVETARLVAQKQEQERLKRELLVAQQIQQRLLPSDLPQPEGYDLAGMNWPCDETSGDYYDVIPYGDGRLALVIGDVSGHGLGPALIMATTRALLRSSLISNPEPLAAICGMNTYLERDIPDNAFMSFFLASLDPESGNLEYVSAGHNPPLLRDAAGEVSELARTGPVLGVIADANYGLAQAGTLSPGSVLMLYTDGIYEAHDAAGEMYGEVRLRASFDAYAARSGSAADVLDGVLADLTAFVGDHPLDDDVTCLVVRVL